MDHSKLSSLIPARAMMLLVLVIGVTTGPAGLGQEIRLPPLFGDNMVLQQARDSSGARDSTLLWGWTTNRSGIQVSLSGGSATQKASTSRFGLTRVGDGWYRWEVKFNDLQAGIYQLKIAQDKYEKVLTNVWVGEVWVSGMPRLQHVPLAPQKVEAILRAIDQKVRVLCLTGLNFSPKDEPVRGWTDLGAFLHDTESNLSPWNFYFAEAFLNKSKGRVNSLGLVVFEPGQFGQPKADALLPDGFHPDNLDWAFDAADDASAQVINDHKAAEKEFGRLISAWKRRGRGVLAPQPAKGVLSFRNMCLRHESLPDLPLNIRGVIWGGR